MKDMTDEKLLELLELYMDMNEKKDEVIDRMGDLLYKQAQELAHYRNLYRLERKEEN